MHQQVRITAMTKVRSYITYALALMEEKGHSSVVLKGMGQAINKAVVVGECECSCAARAQRRRRMLSRRCCCVRRLAGGARVLLPLPRTLPLRVLCKARSMHPAVFYHRCRHQPRRQRA
jgi:hypothetical protein